VVDPHFLQVLSTAISLDCSPIQILERKLSFFETNIDVAIRVAMA